MADGVHYCTITGVFKVWIDGSVVARSGDPIEASTIYRTRLVEKRLMGFMAADRWMVEPYSDHRQASASRLNGFLASDRWMVDAYGD